MIGSALRRLTKLEATMHPTEATDLAVLIEAGRRRAHVTPQAELRAASADRLAGMLARHAERPLRGLELAMMRGLERVHADADLTGKPVPTAVPTDDGAATGRDVG